MSVHLYMRLKAETRPPEQAEKTLWTSATACRAVEGGRRPLLMGAQKQKARLHWAGCQGLGKGRTKIPKTRSCCGKGAIL